MCVYVRSYIILYIKERERDIQKYIETKSFIIILHSSFESDLMCRTDWGFAKVPKCGCQPPPLMTSRIPPGFRPPPRDRWIPKKNGGIHHENWGFHLNLSMKKLGLNNLNRNYPSETSVI